MKTLKRNISESYKVQDDCFKDSESDPYDKNDMKGKMNDFVRLHEAMQEKLKRASYSEQIQILTLLPECTVQGILMSLNTLLELYIKSKK